jgi:uncharacterized membrane protein YphA (DoxX/SURF4 family)
MKQIKWFFQLLTAAILIYMAFIKLTNSYVSIHIFSELGMEPFGRYIVASLELLAGMLLLTKVLPVYGATLSIAVMLGAALAHISKLGIEVQDDGGKLFCMMLFVLISSNIVLFLHRDQIPGVSSKV